MKRLLLIPVLLLTSFVTQANENSMTKTSEGNYQECVAVSLYTMEGRELNSIVTNNRKIEKTNAIPQGWTVIGVTAKKEGDVSNPYLVICH